MIQDLSIRTVLLPVMEAGRPVASAELRPCPNLSSSKFGDRVAGVAGHRREALVGEPPGPGISGGSLALDPGHANRIVPIWNC